MGKVPATEFKAKCLKLMDRVAERREAYVITKHGKPVAKLVPVDLPKEGPFLGVLQGRFRAVSDIVASPLADAEWDALDRERSSQWDKLLRESSPKPATRRKTR